MVIRELIVKIGLQVDNSKIAQLDRDIGKLKRSLQGISQNINQVGTDIINAGKMATIGLTIPILGAGLAAVKVASDFEQLDVAFTTMLGSADKAKEFVDDLTGFAARTPFTIKGIFQSSKQLLAMGIESKKMLPTLKALGDISAGLGVPLSRLALNYGQVRTQGKLTGRELRDFNMAGVPLADTLAKMLGKTVKQIDEMKTRGEISFADVEKAFIKMTSAGGRFEDLMNRQAETIGGVFSNFLDNLIIVGRELGNIIVSTLKLKERLKALTNGLGALIRILKNMQPHQKSILIFLSLFLAAIGPLTIGLGVFIKLISISIGAMIGLKAALFGTAGAAGTFNLAMVAIPALIIAILAAIGLLIEDMWNWVRGNKSIVGKLLGPWEEYRDSILSIFNKIKTAITDYFDGIVSGLVRTKDEIKPILDWIKKEWELFIEFLSLEIPVPGWLKGLGRLALGANSSDQFSGSGFTGIAAEARRVANANTNNMNVKIENKNSVQVNADGNSDPVTIGKKIADSFAKNFDLHLEEKLIDLNTLNPIVE